MTAAFRLLIMHRLAAILACLPIGVNPIVACPPLNNGTPLAALPLSDGTFRAWLGRDVIRPGSPTSRRTARSDHARP